MLTECSGALCYWVGLGSLGHVTVDGVGVDTCAASIGHPGRSDSGRDVRCTCSSKNMHAPLLRDAVPVWGGRRVRAVHVLPATVRWFPGAQRVVSLMFRTNHVCVWFYGYLYSQQYWLSIYGSVNEISSENI